MTKVLLRNRFLIDLIFATDKMNQNGNWKQKTDFDKFDFSYLLIDVVMNFQENISRLAGDWHLNDCDNI